MPLFLLFSSATNFFTAAFGANKLFAVRRNWRKRRTSSTVSLKYKSLASNGLLISLVSCLWCVAKETEAPICVTVVMLLLTVTGLQNRPEKVLQRKNLVFREK